MEAELQREDRPILITGAGTLGFALEEAAQASELSCRLLPRRELDITDAAEVHAAIERHRPWAIINAAGYVHIDAAELETVRCFRDNVTGARVLADLCGARRIPLVSFSSDLVFDGHRPCGYTESAEPRPLGMYGRSKVAAERALLVCPSALVIRSAAFFGAWHGGDFLGQALSQLMRGRRVYAAADLIVTPTYLPDLARASLTLLLAGEYGLRHVTHEEPLSFADLVRRAARMAGLDPGLVEQRSAAALGLLASRPANSALRSDRGCLLRPLQDALSAYISDRGPFRPAGEAAASARESGVLVA